MAASSLVIGLDVGSTTVKAVVMPTDGLRIVWQDYRRHETEQGRTVLDFLKRIWRRCRDCRAAGRELSSPGSGRPRTRATSVAGNSFRR